ncbi:hypothetical protein AQUCO_01000609v1, partial [Aquilegia coerulea]
LPTEILSYICEKLVDISDYARFRAVCNLWRAIVWQIRAKIPPQLPVLMFPNSYYNSLSCMHSHSFNSLSVDRKKCYGSSQGWLITDDYWNRIQLFNPFQSDNNVIKLPSIESQNSNIEIQKAVLSHNPSCTSNYVVMLIYRIYNRAYLAFLKPGDRYWTRVIDREFKDWVDILYYEDRFYAICFSREDLERQVVSFEISSTEPKCQKVAPLPILNFPGYMHTGDGIPAFVFRKTSFMESSGDLLFVVHWFGEKISTNYLSWTVGFQIFKLQQTNEWKWIELQNLGDHALFLEKGGSTSLLVSDFHHCNTNHIYFTHWGLLDRFDVGVFNVADKSTQILFSESITNKDMIQPLWIHPTLNMMRN